MSLREVEPAAKKQRCADVLHERFGTRLGSDVIQPASLFQLCIEYVGRNIHLVESLCGFPEDVGKKIFLFAEGVGKFSSASSDAVFALSLFCDAYNADMLRSLNLQSCHLTIADYLDHLCLFTHLSELDISHCGLGDGHDLLQNIGHFLCLTKLCLCDNALSDTGIQKFTTPLRMYQRGPAGLKMLDLSDNTDITSRVSRYLKCFRLLSRLKLSRTSVRKRDVKKLEEDLKMTSKPEESSKDWETIETRGWAEGVVSDWLNQTERRKKTVRTKSEASQQFYNRRAAQQIMIDSTKKEKICTSRDVVYLVREDMLNNTHSPHENEGDVCLTNQHNIQLSAEQCKQGHSQASPASDVNKSKQIKETAENEEDILNLYTCTSGKTHSSSLCLSSAMSNW